MTSTACLLVFSSCLLFDTQTSTYTVQAFENFELLPPYFTKKGPSRCLSRVFPWEQSELESKRKAHFFLVKWMVEEGEEVDKLPS